MTAPVPVPPAPHTARSQFLLGFLLAVALLVGLGETYLCLFPPTDYHAYLGEASPLTGPFVPDPEFGVAYRSWTELCTDYADRLREFGPFQTAADDRKIWAFFGNSFVQMPGMLADHTRQNVRDHRIFNLGRNELLFVRLAQIKLLLDHGLEPERLFVELMPLDTAPLARQPLSTIQVTQRGALTYRPCLPPGPAGWLVQHSELAWAAWFRSGRHLASPNFRYLSLHNAVPAPLLDDLGQLFGSLAKTAQQHHVPVTVILIPTHEQITRGAGFAFQDALAPLLRQHGLDVFDPREVFLRYPEKAPLFLPDKHFSPTGNDVLLREMLRHLRTHDQLVHAGPDTRMP